MVCSINFVFMSLCSQFHFCSTIASPPDLLHLRDADREHLLSPHRTSFVRCFYETLLHLGKASGLALLSTSATLLRGCPSWAFYRNLLRYGFIAFAPLGQMQYSLEASMSCRSVATQSPIGVWGRAGGACTNHSKQNKTRWLQNSPSPLP